jgi:hypothetical protein
MTIDSDYRVQERDPDSSDANCSKNTDERCDVFKAKSTSLGRDDGWGVKWVHTQHIQFPWRRCLPQIIRLPLSSNDSDTWQTGIEVSTVSLRVQYCTVDYLRDWSHEWPSHYAKNIRLAVSLREPYVSPVGTYRSLLTAWLIEPLSI